MKILTSEQIHQWDAFTIEHEKISSLELMERAVSKCLEWLVNNNYLKQDFIIFCGKGNNGGDGLVLARLLSEKDCKVTVYILETGSKGTDDFQANLTRLNETPVEIASIQSEDQYPAIVPKAILIDALFGSGLNRPVDAVTANLIKHSNDSGNEIISIDIPSGMFADKTSKGGTVIKATHTLTFQSYKLAFLLPENEAYFGTIHVLDIGLSAEFLNGIPSDLELLERPFIKAIYKPRKSFAHKGSYGHALMITGSYGKMGASVLSSKACLRIGVGLLSVTIPSCGYDILQTSVPEAMAIPDANEKYITSAGSDTDLSKYNVVGIGPGIGTEDATVEAVDQLLSVYKNPVVIDADCLNILAKHNELLKKLTPFSILTPHPKEFERLFGKTGNDFERIDLAIKKATELQVIIVLKGHKTLIAMPGGSSYFNSTGNAGMATGGSGDVLTGILTGLLAQKYKPEDAVLLGVYMHGLAGDHAAEKRTMEAMIASDIVECLGDAFKDIAG